MLLKTKRFLIFVSVFFFMIASFCLITYAHPGRTDSNGGHYNRSTGEYHYHHGYPAHQHIDGECPYDYDDQTDHGESDDDSENNGIKNFLILLGLVSSVVLIYIIYSSILTKKRNEQSEKYRNLLLPLVEEINCEEQYILTQSASILRNKFNNIKCEYINLESDINELDREKRKSILVSDYFKSFYDDFPRLSNSMLNDFTINELVNIPERYYFDGKKLCSKNNIYSFELYKTSSGRKIHLIKGCSGSDITINISEFDPSKYEFCRKCFNSKNNSIVYQMLVYGFPTWYKKYMYFYKLKYPEPMKEDELLQLLKRSYRRFK